MSQTLYWNSANKPYSELRTWSWSPQKIKICEKLKKKDHWCNTGCFLDIWHRWLRRKDIIPSGCQTDDTTQTNTMLKNTAIPFTFQQEKKCQASHNCLVFLSKVSWNCWLKWAIKSQLYWNDGTYLVWHNLTLQQAIDRLKPVDGQLQRSIYHLSSTDR